MHKLLVLGAVALGVAAALAALYDENFVLSFEGLDLDEDKEEEEDVKVNKSKKSKGDVK